MYKDAALKVGAEWKAKEASEENKTGWKVEVLNFWDVMVEDAEGEEDALLARYFTYVLSSTSSTEVKLTSSDGVHLTPIGYKLLWKAMSELILTKFQGRGLDFTNTDDLHPRVLRTNVTGGLMSIGSIPRISLRSSNTRHSARI